MNLWNKTAFTLAEVLVTLAVIGVVASLTIPSLIKSYQKTQYEVSYKKAYSSLAQATRMIMADNGGTMKGVANWEADGSISIKNAFASKFKAINSCNWATKFNCWHQDNAWLNLDGSTPEQVTYGTYGVAFVNADGALFSFFNLNVACTNSGYGYTNGCARITMDTNGFKGPNVVGKDIHQIVLRENSIGPRLQTEAGFTCNSTGNGQACGVEILKGTYDWEN